MTSPDELNRLLALVQLTHGADAASALQELRDTDPEFVESIARASLTPEFVSEKMKVDKSERKGRLT